MEVSGLRSLGRGVAYTLQSPVLLRLHAELARAFAEDLTRQDQQRYQPHVVIQNKATPEAGRALLAQMSAAFVPLKLHATGLLLWRYLGGPWELAASYSFAADDALKMK